MPYKLSEDGLTVLNADTGEPVKGGEHASHDDALAHLQALEANVPEAHKALNKAVQDIPALRHATDGADCGHCQLHRNFLEATSSTSKADALTEFKLSESTSAPIPITYCSMYDSKVQCDWTCDEWKAEGSHPDAEPIAENEPLGASVVDSAEFNYAEAPTMTKSDAGARFDIFFPITKVDAEKQEVWGYAILEQADHSGEIMDYASSKPLFDKWSQRVQKDSRGKSKGNVREMHQALAAGKLISFQADDANKGFFVGAKIVDKEAWQKVDEGVYTGFSVGGNYVRRWPDQSLIRYTADPVEISVVDRPCVPGATFQMTKAQGTETRHFKPGDGTHVLPLAKVGNLPTIAAPIESTATRGETMKPTDKDTQARVKVNERVDVHQTYMTPLETSPDSPATGAQAQQHYRPKMDLSAAATQAIGATPPKGITKAGDSGGLASNKVKIIGADNMSRSISKGDATAVLSQVKPIISAVQEQVGRGEVDRALLDQLAAALDVTVEEASDMHTEPTSGSSATPPEDASGGSATIKTEPTGSSDPSTPTSTGTPMSSVPSSGDSSSASSSSSSSSESSTEKPTMSKAATPDNVETFATVPPRSNMNFNLSEDADEELIPAFLQALNSGSLRKAQELVQHDQQHFDQLFTKSLQWYMTSQGITAANVRKLHTGAPADFNPEDLKKAMVSTDIPGIYLMRLARLMLPVYAGMVRRLPAATPETGADKAQWRAQLGFNSLSFANNLHVAEGAIGDEITETFLTFATPYRDLALNDKVTLKATAASRGYDDPLQVSVIRALTALLQLQERKVIGDNAAQIAKPTSVTAVDATPTTGTLGTHTYHPKVSALTYTGWLAGVKGGSLSAGAGETDATAGSVVFGSGSTNAIKVTWPAVPGAVAYNVYIDLDGDNATFRWVATVTTNLYVITDVPLTGNAPSGSNVTLQATGYEGLIEWSELSTIYSNAIPQRVANVDNAGAALSTNGSGITQFDTLLASMWSNWQISPTIILASPTGVSHYTSKIMTLNMPQYRVDVTDKQGQLVGGSFVTYYVNKFAPWADGSQRTIEIMAHPYMPDGTFTFLCESIPYPMSRESRGFARDTLIPYTYFPLAQTAINYPFAVTLSEAVECFHPSAQSAVVGVNVS
jgi:hypothetical protein